MGTGPPPLLTDLIRNSCLARAFQPTRPENRTEAFTTTALTAFLLCVLHFLFFIFNPLQMTHSSS